MKLADLAKAQEGYIIACRRRLHGQPEVGGKEIMTGDFVQEEAEKLGLEVIRVGATGRMAILDTGRPGAGVALRADMDALPVQENPRNRARVRDVISQVPGVCHACGHDGHVAMLLGAMRILAGQKETLCGRVYFCFESDEENGTGWEAMLAQLTKFDVNTVFALHVLASLESGKLSVENGPRMCGMVAVNATFAGRGGHGSRPDLSVNPVFAAASALNNLAVASANQIPAKEVLTLGITSIQGGSAYNVIPDRAKVLGTMRFFNPKVGEKALGMLKSVFDNTAAMYGCTMEYDPMTRIYVIPSINDNDAAQMARAACREALDEDWVVPAEPWYASETFSYYLDRYRGAMGFLGVRNEEKGCGAEHHNEYFDLDEAALYRGCLAYAAYAAAALGNPDVKKWKKK